MQAVRAGQTRFVQTPEIYQQGAGNYFAVPSGKVRKVFVLKVRGGKVTYTTEGYKGFFTTSVEAFQARTKASRKAARNFLQEGAGQACESSYGSYRIG